MSARLALYNAPDAPFALREIAVLFYRNEWERAEFFKKILSFSQFLNKSTEHEKLSFFFTKESLFMHRDRDSLCITMQK